MRASAEQAQMLSEAMEMERESYAFYSSAAALARDANAVRIFLTLARDEIGHLAKLETVHGCLTRGIPWPSLRCPASPFRQRVAPPACPVHNASPDDSPILEAIDQGILAEERTITFYQRAIRLGGEANSLTLYDYLRLEEEGHLNVLLAQRRHIHRTGLWFNYLDLAPQATDQI